MRTLAFIFLWITLLVPGVMAAQQTTPSADETKTEEEQQPKASFFDETTVTATGSERNVFDIATPVTVIREERIAQKKAENAAELLREQPGVDVNGVGPNQLRPVIRGQRGLRVLFLEDGLRLNNPRRQTDFGEIGGLVDLQSVSSIEVVRGPASVLYGSDAIGGVMNVISKEPAVPTDRTTPASSKGGTPMPETSPGSAPASTPGSGNSRSNWAERNARPRITASRPADSATSPSATGSTRSTPASRTRAPGAASPSRPRRDKHCACG